MKLVWHNPKEGPVREKSRRTLFELQNLRHRAVFELRKLSEDEWIDVSNKLLLHAKRSYRGAPDCGDWVQQTIADSLAGQRRWDPALNTFGNLCSMLESVASNRLRTRGRETQLDTAPDNHRQPSISLPCICETPENPSQRFESKEEALKIRTSLNAVTEGDVMAQRLMTWVLNHDVWKPQTAGEELNVPTSEIYRTRRRMQRKWMRLKTRTN